MAYAYIVDGTATQVGVGAIKTARITVNAALTGSIKVIDGITGSTANVATITNPTVGAEYNYTGLANGFRVIASGSCDITAQASSN